MATASADQPLKGLRVLLLALRKLLPNHPGLRLLVVGKLRAGSDTEKLIRKLALASHIDFVSGISTSELVRHYGESTLVVVPSLYEGFGLPIIEAMACGAAVLTSNGSSLAEIAGAAATLADPHDPEALAEALVTLLSDDAQRFAQRTRGLARATEFSWARTAAETAAIYRQVMAA